MLAANTARWAAGSLATGSGLSAWLAAAGGSSAATAASSSAAATAAAAASAGGLHVQQRGLSSSSALADTAETVASASQPAAADGSSALQALADLPPEQRRAAAALRSALVPPLRAAADAALLHALGVAYRDLAVAADLMHKKDILGIPRPLTDDPPPPAAPSAAAAGGADAGAGGCGAAAAPSRTQLFYPVRDLTRLPDPPDCGVLSHLRGRYMGSAYCYMQLIPNHLEVSYQTGSAFMLWPPMEVYSPYYIDYEMAARAVPNTRQRLGRSGTRRRKKQRRVVVSPKATGLMPRAV